MLPSHLLGRYQLSVGLARIWPPSFVGMLPVICWVEENLATLTCWDATSYCWVEENLATLTCWDATRYMLVEENLATLTCWDATSYLLG